MMPTNYDAWLERAYQRKEQEACEYETLIMFIEQKNLHDNPDSLNLYQAREIVEEYETDMNPNLD